MPELVVEGFKELTDLLEFKTPTALRKMAFNVDANIASAGRLVEERRMTARGGSSGKGQPLRMGLPQRKGFWSLPKVRSKWDPNVGWVSTSRMAGKGGTGFRMASFGWERVKKNTVTAPYSNLLANLWHRRTLPYRKKSPLVGTPGNYMRWKAGWQRDARYDWSATYGILVSMQDQAIAKALVKFSKELEGES